MRAQAHGTAALPGSCFGAQERVALGFGAPFVAAGRGRKGPQGRAQGCARFRRQRRMRCRRNPAAACGPCGQEAHRAQRPGCPFSWLLLFGQAKRSDRPEGMRAEHAGTRVGLPGMSNVTASMRTMSARRRSTRRTPTRPNHNSRNAVVTGNLAARSAGNSPPRKPIASAHLRPLHTSAGDTLKSKTTWLKLLPSVDTV